MIQRRKRGSVLFLALILAVILLSFTALTIDMVKRRISSEVSHREVFAARQIAESGLAHALVRLRDGGILEPLSGGAAEPLWVKFGAGQFLYYSVFDKNSSSVSVRSWGRIPIGETQSASEVPPDSGTWDGSGWMIRGIELVLRTDKYLPEAPLYFGNGGIEQPAGGFASGDPSDPSTWRTVSLSSPLSYQASSVPFRVSALDHPLDYLYRDTDQDGIIDIHEDDDSDGILDIDDPVDDSVVGEEEEGEEEDFDIEADSFTVAASAFPHSTKIWASQNPIGQFNIEAWFVNSAGSGNDPLLQVTPTVADWYDTDPTLPTYAFPVDTRAPDVQTYVEETWNAYKDSTIAYWLEQGSHSGTFGDLTNPAVTFVTGQLTVPSGETFEGVGLLVIRDDYDPNTSMNNRPSKAAALSVSGTFLWTGLVLVAGWKPNIETKAGSSSTIVGSILGEDSVMSGGETSLDGATITLKINGPLRLLWCSDVIEEGGTIFSLLPAVKKQIVGIRDL